MKIDRSNITKYLFWATVLILCLTGLFMRFYHITWNDFVFFDEGYYLDFNRFSYDIIAANFPDHFEKEFYTKLMHHWLQLSLATGKALWFFLSDSRIFFGAYKAWFFPRVLAATAGAVTLWIIFLFARRFYNSSRVGAMSALLLAVLPSHVFYSRLAMQETLSTLCFLGGFYLYLFPRKFGYRVFLSGALFAAAFFTNYRLIALPVHVAFCELFMSFAEKRMPDFRKYLWTIVTFFGFVFIVGALYDGANTRAVFPWMFHQAHLAKGHFDWFNFLSYPYYLFRLENFIFALFFFGNIFYLFRKKWLRFFPFALVCLHMIMYSFPQEKAARYLCVILPFVVMSVASLMVYLFEEYRQKSFRIGLGVVGLLAVSGLLTKSIILTKAKSDYRTAMEYLQRRDENVKVVATQNFILNLYTPRWTDVVPFPYKFRQLRQFYARGYRYLVVDPQAYVSHTVEMERFNPQLKDFLGFIMTRKPMVAFDHFDHLVLERFVFEHNENLKTSIAFLKNNDGSYGKIKVYDIGQCLDEIDRLVGGIENIKLNPEYETTRESDKYGR